MTSLVRLHPRETVTCSGCTRPNNIEVVTRDAYPPVIAGLLVLLGVEPVRVWHAGCHAIHTPARTTIHHLAVPFSGTWRDLADREHLA